MKISCKNQYCIYFENNQCILDFISLDSIGVCREGIHVNIEESELEEKRKELFEKLNG